MEINIFNSTINRELQYLRRIENELKIIQRKTVEIGILGSESSEILIIANVNEFGAEISVTENMRNYLHSIGLHLLNSTVTITIPERSFVRRTVDEKENNIINFLDTKFTQVFNGEINSNQFLNSIGEYCVGLTRKMLVDVNNPPNHPFTIEQKGSNNPLIDTGTLLSRISYEVK